MNNFFYSKPVRKDMYMNTKKTTENYQYLTKPFKRYGADMKLGDSKHLQPDIYNHKVENDIKLDMKHYLETNSNKNKAMIESVKQDIRIFDEMHDKKLI